MVDTILNILQMIVSVLLIASILLQQKGAGLGAGFGGGGGIASTKRGVDLFLHKATIILAIVFFALAFTSVFVV
ncbi:MAG: preprotein translocase subunit SecG [Candidatus Magasanikbacteria bacterium]|jgi:preprotein translocase subunit SecG|nr:preprotein translocase subunit SecG [Candidatus Magasanikbacteria bacterium]